MAVKRNVEQNLAEKMKELKRGEKGEISEQGKKIQRKIHNSLNPFSEKEIGKEDEDELLDFLDSLAKGEDDRNKLENIILIAAIVRDYFVNRK